MKWLLFVAGAVLSWGAYGVLLHQGQTQLANPLKALLCVGVAYFLIGVLGYLLNVAFLLVERRVLAWHRGWRASTPL